MQRLSSYHPKLHQICSLKGKITKSSIHKTPLITVRSSRHTLDSALAFKSHFRTVATLARHCLLKMNSIFSSTYGPSTSSLIRLYKSYTRSSFDYGAPATCIASTNVALMWERIQTLFISRAFSIPSSIHNDRKRQHAYLPPIHDRNLYIAKCWYMRAGQYNRWVQDYIDNHTHKKKKKKKKKTTTT